MHKQPYNTHTHRRAHDRKRNLLHCGLCSRSSRMVRRLPPAATVMDAFPSITNALSPAKQQRAVSQAWARRNTPFAPVICREGPVATSTLVRGVAIDTEELDEAGVSAADPAAAVPGRDAATHSSNALLCDVSTTGFGAQHGQSPHTHPSLSVHMIDTINRRKQRCNCRDEGKQRQTGHEIPA